MKVWHAPELNNSKRDPLPATLENRRSSLAISALLNDVSIDPMQHPLAPNTAKYEPSFVWNTNMDKCRLPIPSSNDYFTHHYSPLSSGSSSPSGSMDSHSRRSSITEPPDLWNHSRTGTHQTNNGIVVSVLAKAKRKRILPHQYKRLMETFEKTDTPSSEIRGQLAEELDMTKREVQVWFQNRRAKVSRSKANTPSPSPSLSHTSPATTGRHHSLTTLQKSSSTEHVSRHRRASEYSHPYIKSIAPRNSFSIDQPNTASPGMVLEAPYHPSQSPRIKQSKSAIDILASAAEMMRP